MLDWVCERVWYGLDGGDFCFYIFATKKKNWDKLANEWLCCVVWTHKNVSNTDTGKQVCLTVTHKRHKRNGHLKVIRHNATLSAGAKEWNLFSEKKREICLPNMCRVAIECWLQKPYFEKTWCVETKNSIWARRCTFGGLTVAEHLSSSCGVRYNKTWCQNQQYILLTQVRNRFWNFIYINHQFVHTKK